MTMPIFDRPRFRMLLCLGFAGMLFNCDEPMDAADDEALLDEAVALQDELDEEIGVAAPGEPDEGAELDLDRAWAEGAMGEAMMAPDGCVTWGSCIWRGEDGDCIWMDYCHTSLEDFEQDHCNISCGWN